MDTAKRTIWAILSFLIFVPAAFAQFCSCEHGFCNLNGPELAVFSGRVAQVETPSDWKRVYHFEVQETFLNVSERQLTIWSKSPYDEFQADREYVVFASKDKKGLYHQACTGTQSLEQAKGLVPVLESMKDRNRWPVIIGTLRTSPDWYSRNFDSDKTSAFSGVTLSLISAANTYQVVTDDTGSYSFHDLPPDLYEVHADLGPEFLLHKSPIRVSAGGFYKLDLHAFPTGEIAGKILTFSGKTVRGVSVDLFKAGEWLPDSHLTGEMHFSQGYLFERVPAGDYVLVFNNYDYRETQAMQLRTFFRESPDIEHAAIIHLAPGQKISDANIRVPDNTPTRRITIHVLHADGSSAEGLRVYMGESTGDSRTNAEVSELGAGDYMAEMLPGKPYTILVQDDCAKEQMLVNVPQVNTAEGSAQLINISLPKSFCQH